MDGVKFAHALGINPNGGATAVIDYDLTGRYRRFTGSVGLNDSASKCTATITFSVVADEHVLWSSQPVKETKVLERFDISMNEVQTLELHTHCAGSANSAHCVWVEPKLQLR